MPSFPSYGGGSLNPAWLANQVYVSPSGNNSSSGKAGSPKRDYYDGLEKLISLGGGTLNADSGCNVGGPVPGQGIWIRRDQTVTIDVPGFLLGTVPIRIAGTGGSLGSGAFTNSPVSNFSGGGTRFKPALWILGQGQQPPITIDGIQQGTAGYRGAMIGVDFDRNVDGSIRNLGILNADRTGNVTVFTLDMDTVPELEVVSASRTSNVTTLVINNPGWPYQPWRVGQRILVTTSNPDFSDGEKIITACSNSGNEGSNDVWEIDYSETDGDEPETLDPGIVVQSHNCSAGELIDLVSNTENFLSISYYVTSATYNTVTILDDQASTGNVDADDIGTLVHQERAYGHTNMIKCRNVSFNIRNGVEAPGLFSYPSWDLGSNLAYPLRMDGCWIQGNTMAATVLATRVDRMCASVFAYGGSAGGSGIVLRDCSGAANKIYMDATYGVNMLDCRDLLLEAPNFEWTEPAIKVDGNPFTRGVILDCVQADADPSAIWNEINGCEYTFEVRRSGPTKGKVIGGDSWQNAHSWAAGTPLKNPWVGTDQSGAQPQTWARDARTVGKHPAAFRLGAPVSARFKNVIEAASAWTPQAGLTVTPGGGVANTFGGPSDLVETATNGLVDIKNAGTDGETWEEGGRFVFAGLVNANSDLALGEVFASIQSGSFATMQIKSGYTGRGWQLISGYAIVGATTSNPSYTINIGFYGGQEISLFGLMAHYFPKNSLANGIDDNDFYEYVGTLKYQPRYLLPGMVGTMEDQKFIAHGGLGMKTSLVEVTAPGSADRLVTLFGPDGAALVKVHGQAP